MDGTELPAGRRRAPPGNLALLVGILLVAFLLRIYQAGSLPLRADEAANYFLAIKSPGAIIRSLLAGDLHLPSFYLLLHFWMFAAGSSELSLRYPSIFSSLIVIPLVYRMGRRLFPRTNVAVVAAFLFAINPYSIWDAQDAYMYSMLTAVGLASFLAFERLMRPPASRFAWGAYIIFNALALYVHYLAGLVLVAQGILWLYWSVRRRIPLRTSVAWLGSVGAIALLLAPWLYLALPTLLAQSQSIWRPVGIAESLVRSFTAFSVGRVDSSLMPPMIDPTTGTVGALLISLLVFAGMLLSGRPGQSDLRPRLLLTSYLWVPLFAYFVFTVVRFPIFDERYVLFLVPAFVLLAARGVQVVSERTRRAGAVAIPLVVVTGLSAYSLANYWYVPAYAKSADWPSFVRQLSAEYQKGDLLIQNYPDSALPYYLHNAVPTVLVPGRSMADPANVASRLDKLSSSYERLWFQPAAGANWDTSGLAAAWLERHTKFLRGYSFRGVQLQLFVPASKAITHAIKADTKFANGIRLLAFDVDVQEEADTGSAAMVVLYWQASDQVASDVTVFLHLYDAQGSLLSQQDGQPVHGTYPTKAWAKGETVVDAHQLPIPAGLAAGEYSVVAGLYDSQTKQRIPILDSQRPILPENRAFLTKLDLK